MQHSATRRFTLSPLAHAPAPALTPAAPTPAAPTPAMCAAVARARERGREEETQILRISTWGFSYHRDKNHHGISNISGGASACPFETRVRDCRTENEHRGELRTVTKFSGWIGCWLAAATLRIASVRNIIASSGGWVGDGGAMLV